jgi:hypothetical protein
VARSLVLPFPDSNAALSSNSVDRSATAPRTTNAPLVIGMKSGFVVDGDFLAGFDVPQGDKENVVVEDLHERVWSARMVDVVRTVSAATSVQTPAPVDFTNP